MRIFKKHGMENVGYWHPQERRLSQHAHLHHLAQEPRGREGELGGVQADPEWKKVSDESQVSGRIVSKVVSVFMEPTDYSPIK